MGVPSTAVDRLSPRPRPERPGRRLLAVWGRIAITTIALAAQAFVFVFVLVAGAAATPWVGAASVLVSIGVLTFILNSRMQIEYKLAWAIPILLVPVVSGVFYLLFGTRTGTRRQLARYRALQEAARAAQSGAPGVVGGPGALPPAAVRAGSGSPRGDDVPPPGGLCPQAARQIAFLASAGPFVPYERTQTSYYPVGEEAFEAIIDALEQARRWIVCEYFIVSEGAMWRRLREVLVRKAAAGIEVRFMYDDLGSIWDLPAGFAGDLRRAGVRVQPVNRFGPGLTLRYNNRDHRKILVVDGLVGFTGGINIADEYINRRSRFGHWKDTTIRLVGPGAWGLATLFFSLWDLITGERCDLAALAPTAGEMAALACGPGIVVSYDDTPFDDVSLGWAAYRNLLTRADERVDLMTPYLVPTNEMINVLTSVAASGVRVRILTPGIPDKKYVYSVTRSNYRALVEAGIEVYEYTPGFLHAKQMVVDDDLAIIGTINFDFRSFYLHQEDAVWMYRTSAIAAMSADFEAALAVSRRITLAEVRSVPWWRRAIWLGLRTFSPLM